MASSKKIPGPESNGGFKTVAFGFDKNDVNMYIANLRRKMKTMEEEFEQKLSSALENPAASSDALKHEREIIRAESEKLWGEKLSERNQILKQQQNRINELENELRVSKEKIASLRTQLSAATSENNSDGIIRARAAKAYMQFTRELRSISGTVKKTLEEMEQSWKGEFFGDSANINEILPEKEPDSAKKLVREDIYQNKGIFSEKANIEYETDNVYNTDNADKNDQSLSEIPSELLAEPLPESSESDVKNSRKNTTDVKNDFVPESVTSVKTVSETVSNAGTTAAAEQANKFSPEHSETAPNTKKAIFEGFDDLLTKDSDTVFSTAPASTKEDVQPLKYEKYSPKIEMDDDLSALLAEETTAYNLSDDDFEKLLAQPAHEKDFLITENELKAIKGDDLNALTLSDIVINPGESTDDLGEMLKERENEEIKSFSEIFVTESDDSERIDGLGIKAEDVEAVMDAAGLFDKENADDNNDGKNDDLFDFSFLAAESDDEDDMSTDVSFPRML